MAPPDSAPAFCQDCGTPIPSLALTCPQCQRLVYAARLQELAQQAQAAEAAGDFTQATTLWRQSLILLPPESSQSHTIQQHLDGMDLRAAGHAHQAEQEQSKASFLKRFTGPFAVVGLGLWKFKSLLLAVLTKGKFLFFGLGKLHTLLSALAYVGLYWAWFGWKYALGFVLGIYVHEMGHVWVMRRYGLQPTAPMFIPGFGAFVASYQLPKSVHESARIGLAGPIWGLGSAVFCAVAAVATGEPIWRALAHTLAFINLLNLIPIWILDGGSAVQALDRQQRWLVLAAAGVMLFLTGVGLNILIMLGLAYRLFIAKDNAEKPDWRVAIEMIGLIATLSVLASIPAERPGQF